MLALLLREITVAKIPGSLVSRLGDRGHAR
jgi:hypothetical protein